MDEKAEAELKNAVAKYHQFQHQNKIGNFTKFYIKKQTNDSFTPIEAKTYRIFSQKPYFPLVSLSSDSHSVSDWFDLESSGVE